MSDIYNPIGVISLEGLIGNLTFYSPDGSVIITTSGNRIGLSTSSTPPVTVNDTWNVFNDITAYAPKNNYGSYY